MADVSRRKLKKEQPIKLPEVNSTVYQLKGNRVYRKKVIAITQRESDGRITIWVNRGREIPAEKIGVELFLEEVDARAKRK